MEPVYKMIAGNTPICPDTLLKPIACSARRASTGFFAIAGANLFRHGMDKSDNRILNPTNSRRINRVREMIFCNLSVFFSQAGRKAPCPDSSVCCPFDSKGTSHL